MKIDSITEYSKDYKEFDFGAGKFFCSVRVDFDFALSLPDMENRVYYRRRGYDSVRDRMNAHGVYLVFDYMLGTKEIVCVWVKYDVFCQVPYKEQAEIEKIVELLREYKQEQLQSFCS
ncbi:MAG: hypothetical protein E7290_02135 [Lachnospiraceae bacterium]|nr:hypothetical protein [Lachnospiraceae bacterium]